MANTTLRQRHNNQFTFTTAAARVGHAATATAAAAAAAAAAARWRIERPPPLGLPVVEGQPPALPWPDMDVDFPPVGIFNVKKKRQRKRRTGKVPLFDIKRSGTRALFHLVCVRFCILPTHATGNLQLHAGLAHQQQDKRHRQQPRGRSKSIRKHCVLDFCWRERRAGMLHRAVARARVQPRGQRTQAGAAFCQ